MTAGILPLNSTMSDFDLVALASQGNRAAFKQLYVNHHQRIYALALRLCGHVAQAEEITQECFILVWQKLPQFRGDSQFSTWLHSICVNQALSSIRKQKSFWARFIPIESDIEPHSTDEGYQGLDKLILKLPERARMVFVLCAIEGYQHEEIAKLLGIAVGTSKTQYHRAKQLLQEML
ncbi:MULTISPECIES: RNA polymerase sigma factor [Shewanella]|uniref:RNA polymerase, sigma-24 subunit, ECF subfamily n=3 Tax=Shewanella putrefaciens TaxID=24 RepID=E6XKE6_SHEP2|nr:MULTISPECIES: RNA polymerase sigma factor [Shewanella]CAD6365672.1 ECF RNA polymerase sigma factor SigE [Shewanella hafniensis]ABM26192.1 RNA polymerase, sigma-24 subunit, ECF subfamily [Shewanella sp. W3-18-1]AVV83720.1 RNA polymerase subunit sigma-24 [Shewanella putrefaciens]MCA1898839.1 RNA polymerase sigma factor [Shewanella putrefaciens]MCK7628993.1 RNA polymerase sigma factor [Shewanella sp. JNE9-1]